MEAEYQAVRFYGHVRRKNQATPKLEAKMGLFESQSLIGHNFCCRGAMMTVQVPADVKLHDVIGHTHETAITAILTDLSPKNS